MALTSSELRRFDYNESPILLKRLFVVLSDVAEDFLVSTRSSPLEKQWAKLASADANKMARRMSLAVLRGSLLDIVNEALDGGASVEEALDAVPGNQLVERVRSICTRYAVEG